MIKIIFLQIKQIIQQLKILKRIYQLIIKSQH